MANCQKSVFFRKMLSVTLTFEAMTSEVSSVICGPRNEYRDKFH